MDAGGSRLSQFDAAESTSAGLYPPVSVLESKIDTKPPPIRERTFPACIDGRCEAGACTTALRGHNSNAIRRAADERWT